MSQPQLNSLYQQLILDHYRNPRNKGEDPDATTERHMRNPVCGDEIKLQLQVHDGVITAAHFTGQGCSISQASVSMMTKLLTGKSVEEALELSDRFSDLMRGDEAAARDRSLGDLRALQGVANFPVRIKCALLGFDGLKEALGVGSEGDDDGGS